MSLRNLSAAAGDARLGTADMAVVPGRVRGQAVIGTDKEIVTADVVIVIIRRAVGRYGFG